MLILLALCAAVVIPLAVSKDLRAHAKNAIKKLLGKPADPPAA